MKNVLFILVSLLLLSFLSSCTAEELPETIKTHYKEGDDVTPKEGETEPPIINLPPTKKP